MAKGEPKAWITVRGRRVPIYDGESKADAVKRMTDKDARVKKKVDETFSSSREEQDKSHAKEIEASKAKQRSKAEDNLAGLRAELKKHPNDEHTEYIKKRIKAAEDRVKESGGSKQHHVDKNVSDALEALGWTGKEKPMFIDKMTNGYRVSCYTKDKAEAEKLAAKIKKKTGVEVTLRQRGGYGPKNGQYDMMIPFYKKK